MSRRPGRAKIPLFHYSMRLTKRMAAKKTVIMINCRNFDKFIIAGIWTICLLLAVESQAAESLAEVKIPKALSAGLHHFLDLADPDKAVAMEITPDTHSGAYYACNIHQTLLLFKYRQRNILVTVSRQVDVSTVGKKGYVLGGDDDWDYLYSGILQSRYNGGKGQAEKLPSFLSKSKNHWGQMSRDEMESALVIEYMKYAVGKTQPDEVRALLGLKR